LLNDASASEVLTLEEQRLDIEKLVEERSRKIKLGADFARVHRGPIQYMEPDPESDPELEALAKERQSISQRLTQFFCPFPLHPIYLGMLTDLSKNVSLKYWHGYY
jgi:hypothetical protein